MAITVYLFPSIKTFLAGAYGSYRNSIKKISRMSMAAIRESAIVRFETAIAVFAIAAALLAGNGWIIAAAIPLMIFFPKMYVTNELKKYSSAYNDGLSGFLESVISNLRSGMSLSAAFKAVAERDKTPVGLEFVLVLKKTALGMSLQEALDGLAAKMPSKENEIIISAMNTSLETGGNITEALSNILGTIRKRDEIEREVKTLTSQGVLSGVIVGCLPALMLGIISVFDPGFIAPLFTTAAGVAMLVVAILMEITGAFIISRIVDIK